LLGRSALSFEAAGRVDMYLQPRTVEEACLALAAHPCAVVSGGTDYFPALGDRAPIGPLMDISGLRDLEGIELQADHIRIGARTTWSEIASAALPPYFDALKQAAREVGSVQIQNTGTIGGNLCNASPAADGAPPLLALDAEVELTSGVGRRLLPLAEFLVGNRRTLRRPDELLTVILVPRTIEGGRSRFLKLGARRYLVISIVMVAAIIEVVEGRVRQARVAVGSCSAAAQRLPILEQALVGAPVGPGLGALAVAEHLAPLTPITDVRATAAYRDDAALILVRRGIEACVEGA